VGKKLGAIIPPIGERAIAFTCIVPGRFKATVDTTEHNGFGYHGRLVSFFVVVTSLPEPEMHIGDSRHLLKLPKRPRASYLCIGPEYRSAVGAFLLGAAAFTQIQARSRPRDM